MDLILNNPSTRAAAIILLNQANQALQSNHPEAARKPFFQLFNIFYSVIPESQRFRFKQLLNHAEDSIHANNNVLVSTNFYKMFQLIYGLLSYSPQRAQFIMYMNNAEIYISSNNIVAVFKQFYLLFNLSINAYRHSFSSFDGTDLSNFEILDFN